MNAIRHIDPEDLALFALQFLTPEQNQQVLAHLEGCSLCRIELAQTQGDLAVVAGTAEMHSPPALARERLVQQIAREPKARSTSGSRSIETAEYSVGNGRYVPEQLEPHSQTLNNLAHPSSSSGSTPSFGAVSQPASSRPSTRKSPILQVLPWAGWAVAAGLAVMVAQSAHQRYGLLEEVQSVNHQIAVVTAQSNEARRLLETINDPSAQRVTLTLSKQTPVPQGKATYVPAKGALVFVANNLEPLEPAKVYELWIIPASGSAPVPVGTFHPDAGGNASLIMPKLPQGVTAKAFGITIENEGGAATPTMPIIMAGAAGSSS